MSAWRRKALKLFPELKRELNDRKYTIYLLYFDLLPTLDWGSWSPDFPNLGLQSGRSVSVEVLQAVQHGREVEAIKAFRACHPDATFKEAREAYAELSAKMRSAPS